MIKNCDARVEMTQEVGGWQESDMSGQGSRVDEEAREVVRRSALSGGAAGSRGKHGLVCKEPEPYLARGVQALDRG
jgi:hypothetical protein